MRNRHTLFRIIFIIVVVVISGTFIALANETVESRSFVVESIKGESSFMTRRTPRELPVREGIRLADGNTLNTGLATTIDIKLDDDSLIRMNESTKLDVSQASRTALVVTVVTGSISVNADMQSQDNTVTTIIAGNTTMGIRGTLFTVTYTANGGMRIVMLEGSLEVSTPDGTFTLEAGQIMEVYEGAGSEHPDTNIIDLDITQIPDSFTLELIKEHSEMLVELGVITAEEVSQLDALIEQAQAQEAAQAEATHQSQQEQLDLIDELQRNIIYLPTGEETGTGTDPGTDPGTGGTPPPTEPEPEPEPEPTPPPIPTFTVTFEDWNYTVLKTEVVNSGANATPPADPTRTGYTFNGWTGVYTGVTSNRTITATYLEGFAIRTAADLQKIGTGTDGWTLGATYVLMNNVTAPTNFIIGGGGQNGTPFTGTFNGNGNTITVNITAQDDRAGLFNNIQGGTVRNLTVGGTINGSGFDNIGGIAGYNNGGTIANCVVSANVSGDSYTGGIVGVNSGSITSCTLTGNVQGADTVGGITGINNTGSTVTNSHSSGTVTGNRYIGGVVGQNNGSITGSSNSATVNGDSSTGGIAGENEQTISGSYSTGTVTGTGSEFGGLVGANHGILSNCYATGMVIGESEVGGLAGFNGGRSGYFASIENCYSSGIVSGYDNVGGVVGMNGASNEGMIGGINNCEARGTSITSGDVTVGRIVGLNDTGSTLTNNRANVAMTVNGSPRSSNSSNSLDGLDWSPPWQLS